VKKRIRNNVKQSGRGLIWCRTTIPAFGWRDREKGRNTSNLRWNTDYPDCRFRLLFSFYPSKCWNLLQIRREPLPSMSSTVCYSL